MEFFEVVSKRQSVRRYQMAGVEEEKIRRILEAANRAPSAGNLQAYRIFVVKRTSLRKILAQAAGDQRYVAEAPVVLVFCADPLRSARKYGARGEQLYCIQDATIACAYAQLAAAALGLASVWVGAVFEPETIREALAIPGDLWPIALLPIGHAAEHPQHTPRRSLCDLAEVVG